MTNIELQDFVKNNQPKFKARSSEVYDLNDGTVLKLYFEDIDDENVEIEYLNTSVAFEQGCTPMECFGKVEINGRKGLILKKLEGIALTSMPEKNPLILFKAGKILGGLHALVHSKESDRLRDVRKIAVETLDKNPSAFDFLSEEDLAKTKEYILSLPEKNNIIHLDFHTDNILCDGDNNQVIDWMTAMRGDPLCEVAMMNFLFHDAELFPGSSKIKIFFMQLVRTFIYNGFIKNYEELTGLKEEDSAKWNVVVYILRKGIWDIASEKADLQQKIENFVKNIK